MSIVTYDSTGNWAEVIGYRHPGKSRTRAWVPVENLTSTERDIRFTVAYHRAMAMSNPLQREYALERLFKDPYLKQSELLFAASYVLIKASSGF